MDSRRCLVVDERFGLQHGLLEFLDGGDPRDGCAVANGDAHADPADGGAVPGRSLASPDQLVEHGRRRDEHIWRLAFADALANRRRGREGGCDLVARFALEGVDQPHQTRFDRSRAEHPDFRRERSARHHPRERSGPHQKRFHGPSHFEIFTRVTALTRLFARTKLPSLVTEVLRTMLPPSSGTSRSWDRTARPCSGSTRTRCTR